MHEIELFIAINEEGEFKVSTDSAQDAVEELNGEAYSNAIRTFALKLNVPLPKVAEVAGTLPDTDGPVTLTING